MLALVTIKPSKQFIGFVTLFYSATTFVLLTSQMCWLLKLLSVLLVAISAKRYYRQHIMQTSSSSVLGIAKTHRDFWSIQLANGEIQYAYLKAENTLATQFLVILNFFTERRKKIFVIITPGCINPQNYRRLLMHLYHDVRNVKVK